MSQAQRLLLPHEGGIARHQPGWGKDGKILAALRRGMFQLIGNIEMIFDDALSAAGDKDHLLNASLQGFIDGILNERPIHDRQHFLGHDLRRGQESCAKSSDRKDRSEEHTSELQSLMRISYAVFCLKTKNTNII